MYYVSPFVVCPFNFLIIKISCLQYEFTYFWFNTQANISVTTWSKQELMFLFVEEKAILFDYFVTVA